MFEGGLFLVFASCVAWLVYVARQAPSSSAQDDPLQRLLDGEPVSVLSGLGASARRRILEDAIRAAERVDPEWVAALGKVDPMAGFAHVGHAASAHRHDVVARVAKAVLKQNRSHVAAADALVRAYVAMGQAERAGKLLDQLPKREPVFRLLRAEMLLSQERLDEATPIVMEVLDEATTALQHGLLDGGGAYWQNVWRQANDLREGMLASVSTHAEVFRAKARGGELQVRSAANHLLAGLLAMAEAERIARDLQLQPPDLGADHPLRRAEAELRAGSLPHAKKSFFEMVDRDPAYFPGQLGLGAVLLRMESRSEPLVARWSGLDVGPEWDAVFPDRAALTAAERSVVAASIAPLASVREAMVERGATVVFLALDVRPTDRRELEALAGQQADDGRAFDAIAGLAQRKAVGSTAFTRIEVLLAPAADRTFAHEFAHLAFWHLPAEVQDRITQLYEEARQVEWAWTAYQAKNVDEFFAVSYEDWLGERWGVVAPRPDSSGWWRRVCDVFEDIEHQTQRQKASPTYR